MPRLSLRTKLLVAFLAIMVPVLGLLVYGYLKSAQQQVDAVLEDQMQTAQAIGTLVDASFDEAITLGWSISNDPFVRTFDKSRLDPYLATLITFFPQYFALTVVDASGSPVASSTAISSGSTASDRAYFQQVMATGQPAISPVLVARGVSPQTAVIVVAVPVRNEAGDGIGAVLVPLHLQALSNRLDEMALNPEQQVLLVDEAGVAALHTAFSDLVWEQRDLSVFGPVKAALDGNATTLRRFTSPLQNDIRIGAFVPTPKYGWVVGVTEREDVALAPVRSALRDQLLGLGAIAVLTAALAFLTARALIRPISRLTSHALALGRGELHQRANIVTGDELEKLGQTFDEMAERLAGTLGELRESEELYRTLAEAARDIIFVVSREGYVEYVNSFAASQFGAPPDEIIGKRRDQLFPAGTADTQESHLRRVLQTNKPIYIEEKTRFGDHREVWLGTWLVPIEKAGKARAVMGISRDITERRALDHLKDQFIAIAAHELKTPLAIMKGYAQALLRTAGEVSERQRKMLESIDRGSDRIDAVVRDLLDISELVTGRLDLEIGPVDLHALILKCIDRVSLIDMKHRIRMVSAEPAIVKADRQRVEQVMMHLLDNAMKYSPAGGDVDVRVAVSDHEAVVSVRDHGVGIPSDRQALIFQRFYSAHSGTPYAYGGEGVGLYISKELVVRHGGRMWFESEEGKGSVFYFTLPIQTETLQSHSAGGPP